ncbi:hypothetical protein [uncultured Tenacibaculum sp.]|uniref:hypothetical protein n=1 Tax=uncultured Tenacibaculum sp. TaxID=174713 RepID=UPI00262CFC42|nr:hypothetical protein [uncultured Tenacibaculum sp.]
MKKLFIAIVFIYSVNSFAQAFTGSTGRAYRNTMINYIAENKRFENNKEFTEEFEGSAFIQNGFKVGVINDNTKKHVLFKYNAYRDEILIKNEENLTYYTLLKGLGTKIKALNTHNEDVYIVFKHGKKQENRFFKHVFHTVDKKIYLLIKEKVIFVEGKKPKTGYDEYEKPHFKKLDDKFYVSFDDENAIEIPKSRRKFTGLFGDKKDKIKSFIKRNKKDHREKQDLIAILKYYNSL